MVISLSVESEFGAGLKARRGSRSRSTLFLLKSVSRDFSNREKGGATNSEIQENGRDDGKDRLGMLSFSNFPGWKVNRRHEGSSAGKSDEIRSVGRRRGRKGGIVQPKEMKEAQKRRVKKVPEKDFRFLSVLCQLLQNQRIQCLDTISLRTERRLERRKGKGEGETREYTNPEGGGNESEALRAWEEKSEVRTLLSLTLLPVASKR